MMRKKKQLPDYYGVSINSTEVLDWKNKNGRQQWRKRCSQFVKMMFGT